MIEIRRAKSAKLIPRVVASEYSDHTINLNKLEDRNLAVRIKQINREEGISVNIIKREIDRLKREYEENRDAMELIRRIKQMEYDENLRKLLEREEQMNKDMDLLYIHNTSKNLAFYNLSSTAAINSKKRRSSARNRYMAPVKPRSGHSQSKISSHSTVSTPTASAQHNARLVQSAKPRPISITRMTSFIAAKELIHKDREDTLSQLSQTTNKITRPTSSESHSSYETITSYALDENALINQKNMKEKKEKEKKNEKKEKIDLELAKLLQQRDELKKIKPENREILNDKLKLLNRRMLSTSAPIRSNMRIKSAVTFSNN